MKKYERISYTFINYQLFTIFNVRCSFSTDSMRVHSFANRCRSSCRNVGMIAKQFYKSLCNETWIGNNLSIPVLKIRYICKYGLSTICYKPNGARRNRNALEKFHGETLNYINMKSFKMRSILYFDFT